jgi:hypothetical protein
MTQATGVSGDALAESSAYTAPPTEQRVERDAPIGEGPQRAGAAAGSPGGTFRGRTTRERSVNRSGRRPLARH